MEVGNTEVGTKPEATKNTPPLYQRVRQLKDRVMPKEEAPLSWEGWKQIIIANRDTGISEGLAPKRFAVSQSLLDTFHELLPIKSNGQLDTSKPSEEVERARAGLEVDRSLVLDPSGTRLLVNRRGSGDSHRRIDGASLMHRKRPGEIGIIHTHPNDAMPSSTDLIPMLVYNDVTGMIVTPRRVIVLFRTDQTLVFPNLQLAKQVLDEIGRAEHRVNNEGNWMSTSRDLRSLDILRYEAIRGEAVFTRQDK